jgi:hypothetical protein
MHLTCCAASRHSISELYASVDECFQDLECVVEDDYKFLYRNVRKLFGMVGNKKESGAIVAGSTIRFSFLP